MTDRIEQILLDEHLPRSFISGVLPYYKRLADFLLQTETHCCQLIAINGAQGTGKSTLCLFKFSNAASGVVTAMISKPSSDKTNFKLAMILISSSAIKIFLFTVFYSKSSKRLTDRNHVVYCKEK